ncbi:hypothetical protein [Trichoplusia ni ascovirus 2c]|uniref:hypothetical protein n=1 Tax=Trichoplusia ni ascovirus 2c TaxID=328615 RepID=UPI0000E44226|nr:hypothetical protein TNAV2c_gp078 [Trichoplusia ni ascovirus 2c]ABF70595.1 hypothetical protein [Trichoplusia ni ascovirus 2c]
MLPRILRRTDCEQTATLVALEHNTCDSIDVGKYAVDSIQYERFLEYYVDLVERGKANLAEIPSHCSPIRLDIDLKVLSNETGTESFSPRPPSALYTKNDVINIVDCLHKAIKSMKTKNYQNDDAEGEQDGDDNDIAYILLEKPPRLDKQYVKHGFHIHTVNGWVTANALRSIISTMKNMIGDYTFKCGILAHDAIDDVTNKPWLMYGSTKASNMLPYLVTNAYKFEKTTNQWRSILPHDILNVINDHSEFMNVEYTPNRWNDPKHHKGIILQTWIYALSIRMSVVNSKRFRIHIKSDNIDDEGASTSSSHAVKRTYSRREAEEHYNEQHNVSQDDDDDDDNLPILSQRLLNSNADDYCNNLSIWLNALNISRATEQSDWMKTFWAILNCVDEGKITQDQGFHLFDEFSSRCNEKYDAMEVAHMWNQQLTEKNTKKRLARKAKITVGTIIHNLKKDNPVIWKNILSTTKNSSSSSSSTTTTKRRRLQNVESLPQPPLPPPPPPPPSESSSSNSSCYFRDESPLNDENEDEDIDFTILSDTDVDIANVFLKAWKKKIMYLDDVMFKFNGTLWKYAQEEDAFLRRALTVWVEKFKRIADDHVQELKQVEVNEAMAIVNDGGGSRNRTLPKKQPVTRAEYLQKVIDSIWRKCKNSNTQSGIVKAIKTICTTGAGHDEMVQMDNNENLTAFEDMVFCNETLTMRNGRPEDMLSRCLKCKYIPYEQLEPEAIEFVNIFYSSLFPDKEICEYFQLSCSQIFGGRNVFKQYQVWTGVGNNGKSMCIKLFETMLGRLFSKLNKSVLTSLKHNIGAANPDMYRLRGVRMVVTDELAKSDELNVGQTKLLSGGDSFIARDLYQKSTQMATIKAQFIPIIVCNDLPLLRDPDEAAWRRERVIPFESYFAYSNELEIPEEIPKERIQMRDDNIMVKINKYMPAFASCLLKKYIDFEKLRRSSPYNDDCCEKIPAKVLLGIKRHRLQQNIIRIVIDTKFSYDPTSNEILTFERLCVLVNDHKRKGRPVELNEIIRTTRELSTLRNYECTQEGVIGLLPLY